MPPDFVPTWLKLTSLFVALLGLLIASGAHPAIALPATWLADIVFWPFDGQQPLDTQSARALAAISGGVMVGWACMMWLIIDRLLPSDPRLTRLLLVESTLAWFVVDSAGSFAAGAGVNVLLNTVLMLAIVLPAWQIGSGPVVARR